MRLKIFIFCCVLLLLTNLYSDKYAGEIFKLGAGVRNYSLGRTGLTDTGSLAATYWNSALLLYQNEKIFDFMHAEEFNGLMKYDTFSGTLGESLPIGFTLSRIAINNIALTKLPNEDIEPGENNQPYKYKSVNNVDYIMYFGYAFRIGNTPIGITPKIVYRNLANTPAYGFGADVGTFLELNDFFALGLRIRDIIPTQIYWDNGTHESVDTGFDAELKINTQMPIIELPLHLFVNTEINTIGIKKNSFINIGDVSIDPHCGAELILHPMVSFMAGYNIDAVTTGVGLHFNQFLLNYSFEQNPNLDNSHRFSIAYKM